MTAIPLPRITAKLRVGAHDPVLIAASVVCLLLVVMAIFGPLLAPHSPTTTDILAGNAGSSADHLLGTDALGRDIVTRLLYGARLSLLGPAVVIAVASVLGTALALVGAWFGGWVDSLLARVLDVLLAFPGLLIAVLAVGVFGKGLVAPVVALAIAYTPYLARVVRSVAIRERSSAYVEACTIAGFSSWRILLRHVLPATLPVLAAQATIGFGAALTDLAAISFVGLGVQAPTAEWGAMVAGGRNSLLNGFPAESLSAGVLIVITIVAFNVLGERLSRRGEQAA